MFDRVIAKFKHNTSISHIARHRCPGSWYNSHPCLSNQHHLERGAICGLEAQSQGVSEPNRPQLRPMWQGWMLCVLLGLTFASQTITAARIISDHSREGVLIGYSEQARQAEYLPAGKIIATSASVLHIGSCWACGICTLSADECVSLHQAWFGKMWIDLLRLGPTQAPKLSSRRNMAASGSRLTQRCHQSIASWF